MDSFSQMLEKSMNSVLKKIHVATIEEYPRETNHIVMLSFGTNHDDADASLANYETNLCSALSRARRGLYMFGNMESFAKINDVWEKIRRKLQNSGSFGGKFRNSINIVGSPQDSKIDVDLWFSRNSGVPLSLQNFGENFLKIERK